MRDPGAGRDASVGSSTGCIRSKQKYDCMSRNYEIRAVSCGKPRLLELRRACPFGLVPGCLWMVEFLGANIGLKVSPQTINFGNLTW